MERYNTELELFSPSITQSSIIKSLQREFFPISPLQHGNQITFNITGSDLYLDLSKCLLYVTAKIQTAANANPGNDTVGPINLTLHSLFSKVEVELGATSVADSNQFYYYGAYLKTILNSPSDNENQLHTEIWHKDTAEHLVDFAVANDSPNNGLVIRSRYFATGNEVEMIGRIHSDIFEQPLALLSNLDMKIKLYPNRDNFVLVTPAPAHGADQVNYKIVIMEAKLIVQSLLVSPSLSYAHNQMLQKCNARYPIMRTSIKIITVPRGQSGIMQDNIYLGKIPSRVVMAMVTDAAMAGGYQQNPFNFQHFGLNYLAMYVNGDMVPNRPYQPDFAHNKYLREYSSLFDGIGRSNCVISRNDYPNGYTIWIFKLSPVLGTPSKPGTVRLEIKFSAALNETINIILFAEFNSIIEIDKYRNVSINNE